METASGILGRLGEKVLGWIALGLLVAIAIAIYQTPAATKAAIWAGIWRTCVWVAVVAVVPWSATLFISRIMEAGTNWAGVGLIAAVTVIDLVLGVLLLTSWPGSVWTWLAALGAIGVAGTYNFLVAEYLADRSGL